MATTSFLYHSFGVVGYHHLKTEYVNGAAYHHIERHRHRQRCQHCGSRWYELVFSGWFERILQTLPVGRRRQFVVIHGHELRCKVCGRTRREEIPLSRGKRRVTKALENLAIDMCGIATIKDVATWLGLHWTLVKSVFKEHLRQRAKRISLKDVRLIAVDEFAVRKGHKYMTVVLNLTTGQVLHSQQGRGAESLRGFLNKLKRAGAQLEAVAMDMWPAYVRAVEDVFPDVDIVHDPFHVVAMANKAIDDTRRDLYRELQAEERKVIKGCRFLLLKGLENLKEPALDRLLSMTDLNETLLRGYLLKEDLRMFWRMPNRAVGCQYLDNWIKEANSSGLKHFIRLAETLDRHRGRLLTYFDHRISTGPLEGLNNKIKVLKRQAYGFRDMEYFRLRLAFLHENVLAYPG